MGTAGQVASGTLWLYCLPFGFVYYFLGQIAWLKTLELNAPVTINIGTNILFIVSLLFAAVIIKQYIADASQWVASSIILLGIVSSIYEIVWKKKHEAEEAGKGEGVKRKESTSSMTAVDAGQEVMNVMLPNCSGEEDKRSNDAAL